MRFHCSLRSAPTTFLNGALMHFDSLSESLAHLRNTKRKYPPSDHTLSTVRRNEAYQLEREILRICEGGVQNDFQGESLRPVSNDIRKDDSSQAAGEPTVEILKTVDDEYKETERMQAGGIHLVDIETEPPPEIALRLNQLGHNVVMSEKKMRENEKPTEKDELTTRLLVI
ncbi:hypothetical protein KIN20_007939 [Parelaphostrongylus tenuis]|uniref:Uncharacterized protein n=1 Tax=Parelaphostrongylus tenuis TaxID=148309 RepID=A0AAD5QH55_PARTN|nr:hypothetical protein KIN20_007939 [Parelaphostrongylus tenuis]